MAQQDIRLLTRQILWSLWHSRKFLLEFRDKLWPEFFGSPEARYLLTTASDHFGAYGTVPTKTILQYRLDDDEDKERLDREGVTVDGVWGLFDRLEPVGKAEYKDFWRESEEFCRRQHFSLALREALATLDDEGVDAAFEIINAAKTELQKPEARTASLIAGMQEALTRIGTRESDDDYFSTGIPYLDHLMGGGLKPGELACFVAPTGRGKSMWLCHLAYFGMMQGADVVYYTFEVDRDEIWLRTMAAATGLPIDDLKTWAAYGDRDPEYGQSIHAATSPARLIAQFKKSCALEGAGGKDVLIRDIPPRQATIIGLAADLDSIRAEGRNPRLVIVDYADRMQARGRFERAWEGQPQVYQDLVSLAKEQDLAIWTAAQGNRESLNTSNLNLRHMQGAFAKAFEASFVIGAGQDEPMRRRNYVQFYMAKARRSKGADQRMWVWYDFSTSRFVHAIPSESDEDDVAAAMTKVIDLEAEEEPKEKFG